MKNNLILLAVILFATNLISANNYCTKKIHLIISNRSSTPQQVMKCILDAPTNTYISQSDLNTAELRTRQIPSTDLAKKLFLTKINSKKID